MNAQDRFIARQNTYDASCFRSAMRHLASGVSVITTGQGEHRSGLTATSVSSLSMEPPSLVTIMALVHWRCAYRDLSSDLAKAD
jgi:flavin reductase (DIM6/NTAB) family NADH-FMN oxidoreductase RutF